MLALCLMLLVTYYALNYALNYVSIIGWCLNATQQWLRLDFFTDRCHFVLTGAFWYTAV